MILRMFYRKSFVGTQYIKYPLNGVYIHEKRFPVNHEQDSHFVLKTRINKDYALFVLYNCILSGISKFGTSNTLNTLKMCGSFKYQTYLHVLMHKQAQRLKLVHALVSSEVLQSKTCSMFIHSNEKQKED